MTRDGILFDGWFGQRNTGDDVYCVVGAHVALEDLRLSPRFIGRPSALPQLPPGAVGVSPEHPRFSGQTRLAHLRAALRCDLVVHLGGSRFTTALRSHRDIALLGRAGGTRASAASISVGPFSSSGDAAAVGRLIRGFRAISVRDSASVERVREIAPDVTVHRGFDAAVLLPAIAGVRRRHARPAASQPTLGVSVCPHESVRGGDERRDRERLRRIRELVLRVVSDSGCRVRLLTMCAHPVSGDQRATEDLRSALSAVAEVDVEPYSTVTSDMLEAIARCDAVVAMRLHGAVLAYSIGVPFAVASYSAKNLDFAEEVGVSAAVRFDEAGPDPSQYVDVVRLLEDDPVLRPMLPLADARQRARDGLIHAAR